MSVAIAIGASKCCELQAFFLIPVVAQDLLQENSMQRADKKLRTRVSTKGLSEMNSIKPQLTALELLAIFFVALLFLAG